MLLAIFNGIAARTYMKTSNNGKNIIVKSAPKKGYKSFPMLKSKKSDFIHVDIIFENDESRFLFDTGATLTRNGKEYAISFP